MIVRLIVQTNSVGEKHVIFTQDSLAPINDLLLTAPGWEHSDVVEGRVLILGMDAVIDALMDTELHSAETEHPCCIPNERIKAIILSQLNGEVK